MTPRPAATLLIVRAGPAGLEVLMVERPARGFFGGLWVFPGGGVDAVDGSPEATAAVALPPGCDDGPWRVAALRETAEEVGLVLSLPPWDGPLDATGIDVFRRVIAAGSVLDGRRLRLLSQWVTPAGAPTRFDARFYLTVLEGDPSLVAQPEEVIDLAWVAPAEALVRAAAGTWSLITPTVSHLEWLSGLDGVDAAWAAATPVEGRSDEPFVSEDGSEVRVRLPAIAEP